ncbi:MAG: bifunctional riboflavin kinase/FAD synthetase, partial [Desulfobacterales bacterium]|nr:bifunctional riboflavin kinase/FAD synthetase [Desulfobacterales bacterium]
VHKGHLALFDLVKEKAGAIGGQSVVMTFEPHPIKIVTPGGGPPLITPTQQKLRLIEDSGIDIVLCIPFTRQFAAISAHDFIQDILIKKIGVKEIIVGYDYTFGHGRKGTIELLQEMGNRFGFGVYVLEQIRVSNTPVSSTSIRNFIQDGNLSGAKKLLGRDYQVRGTVVKGKNRGARLLGFPTANLKLVDELTPKVGVYAVRALIDDRIYDGLTNIGYNPTFGNHTFSVETHILDFSDDLLGKTIKVNFLYRLRDEKTFESIEDLAAQIGRDISRARELFKKTPS